MRVLQIVHDFLPRHVAGVEVYTDHIARGLARDHDVALLYSEVVPEEPNYALRRGSHGDIATYEIVNNQRFARFEETYENPAVEARVRQVLDEFRPEVVHVQHLINLSLGVLRELDRRGIPVVMTLHEHWLACARGGQRFHGELGRCEQLDAERCAECTIDWHARRGWRDRFERLAVQRGRARGRTLRLTSFAPDRIETPDARFVYRDRYVLHGSSRDAWVTHPPSRLAFDLVAEEGARFRSHVAMHPSTFDTPGGAVRFSAWLDGVLAAEVLLDPRRVAGDRFAHPVELDLAPGPRRLELRADADPPDHLEFATGAWVEPSVENALPAATSGFGARAAARLLGAVGGNPYAAATQAIERRWKLVRDLARCVDLFLLPSRHLLEEMARFGLPAEKMVHCDYGFPVDAFERRRDLPDRARHFAFIGSVMRHKGMHILLEAFEEMPGDARLSVAGSPGYDPAYAAWLQSTARHPGIRFLGGISPEAVPAFLAGVDVLVVPSIWWENSPLTIHEGFLAGVPVVASRMGGSTELIEAGGGLLYDADRPEALREVLRRLYDESGLARQLAASAPPVKSVKDHVAELVGLYQSIRTARGLERGLA